MKRFEEYVFSDHARAEMQRRGIPDFLVREVLQRAEATLVVRPGRIVVQSTFTTGQPPKEYLVRVFIDIDRSPPTIVTAYRTSNLTKYRAHP